MKQPTSLQKQSKRAKREYYSQQRGTWNGVNPVTKTVPNKKAYSRLRDKIESRSASREYGC